MRAILFLLLLSATLFSQGRLDTRITEEFQKVMELAAPPAGDGKLDEEAARERAESFKASLAAFLENWKRQADRLTTGKFVYARALALAGRQKEAIPVLESFLHQFPDSEDAEEATLMYGAALLDTRRPEKAVSVFREFLARRKKSDRRHVARYYLGLARYEMGEIEAGIQAIGEVASSGIEDRLVADANVKYVELLRDAGRVAAALAHLEKLLEKSPEAPYLLTLREQLEMIGKPAPEFRDVGAWAIGPEQTVAASRGHVLVLVFFVPWAEPSLAELEALAGLKRELGGRDVRFVGMTKFYTPFEKKPREVQLAEMRKLLAKQGVDFPVGMAESFANLRAYGVRGVPHTVVIGKDGRIAYVKYGGSRKNAQAIRNLKRAIERALR